jgi:hypothetical protein
MLRSLIAGFAMSAIAFMMSPAEARPQHHQSLQSLVHEANLGGAYCNDRPWTCDTPNVVTETTRRPVAREWGHRRPAFHGVHIYDLVAELSNKVSEIIEVCRSRLISGYRPGARVAGSGHPSLHSTYPSKAADLSGDPNCIYAHLQGWPGGYSTDYGHVRHVHLSYSPPGSGYLAGREWHARFAHYGGGHHHHHRHAHVARG